MLDIVKDLSRRQRRQFEQQLEDLEILMKSQTGRRFLRRLIENLGVFKPVFDEKDQALHNFGLGLVNEVSMISPTAFPALMMEAANEQLAEKVAAARKHGQASLDENDGADE